MKAPVLFVALTLVAAPAVAQSGRRALTAGAERYLLADYQGAVPELSQGLDPTAGPLDQQWLQGVERLADVLSVLRQDSLAATWLRWAVRIAPTFAVDEDVVPPIVVRAAAAARAFVDSTPHDRFVARIAYEWPAMFRADAPGVVRLAPAAIPITARIGVDQFMRGGESRRLPPGSYDVVASAPGFLPTRLTVELLPGITTVVAVSLLPETAGLLDVTARPWGTLLLDGTRIGYTSVAAHRLIPGRHTLRLELPGSPPLDTTIVVADRQQIRLSWVTRRDTTGDAGLDDALATLDGAEIERGTLLVREWLTATPLAAVGRATALARLAEATWSLGMKDSARAHLREIFAADPFYSPPADLFNPELRAAYQHVRRATAAIAIRAARDTVLTPLGDSVRVQVAVGQPGEVRLLLRLTNPRPRDSVLAALFVDSVATASVPLMSPDGSVLPPGQYVIEGEIAALGPGTLLRMTIERLPVDTLPHAPDIPSAEYRPETRRGTLPFRTIGEGLGLGALAVLASAVVNDREVSGRRIPSGSWVIGASVALATFTLRRPTVPIPESIAHNAALRAALNDRNRAIAAGNATTLQTAPLRIRTTREP